MSYKNATEVLPPDLLEMIQAHFSGGTIYIPKTSDKKGWGELSGTRRDIQIRNNNITVLFKKGKGVSELADQFFLSVETIKKIVYTRK